MQMWLLRIGPRWRVIILEIDLIECGQATYVLIANSVIRTAFPSSWLLAKTRYKVTVTYPGINRRDPSLNIAR